MKSIRILFVISHLCILLLGTAWASDSSSRTTPITVTMAALGTVIVTEEAVGRIEARVNPKVSAEVAGRVKEIFVNAGQRVKAGMLLASIDSEQQELEIEALQADVGRLKVLILNQERTVKRYRNLLEKKSIAQDRFDREEMTLASLKEQLDGANARIADSKRRRGYASVNSPVDGWVEKRFISKGDYVKVGTPVCSITTDQQLRVVLPFPEGVASKFKIGQKVSLTSPLTQDLVIKGKVSEIKPSVNTRNRSIEVIVYVKNPGIWRPGATVNGTVVLEKRSDSVLIPAQCVIRRPAGEVVYVVENSIVSQRIVETGIRQGHLIEIVKGLEGAETVVLDGAGFLTDGAQVSITGQK